MADINLYTDVSDNWCCKSKMQLWIFFRAWMFNGLLGEYLFKDKNVSLMNKGITQTVIFLSQKS